MTPENLLHPVHAGSCVLPGNLCLAPVAGYSDAAFRSIVAGLGCDFAFTEMVSSEALTRGSRKTLPLLERAENETAYAIQLFGADPSRMAEAAIRAMEWSPSLIDVNCGCPVPKIVKTGAGSALLREPAKIGEIVRAMAAAVPVPVTVKIRLGWDDASVNFLETASVAQDAGAAAVTMHARTRAQGYSGRADWTKLADLKRTLAVPVFGSGDVSSPEAALRMLAQTGVDGVMFARGVMGDPFVFMKTKELAATGTLHEVPVEARIEVAWRHFGLCLRFLGERTACVEFRKQFCAYTKGGEHGALLRARAVKASTCDEWKAVFEEWRSAAAGQPF
ncbi:MAG: tRNA dihydrouridine synthase DusB [Spirochaetes bacterium]|nr:tRNA dihydrouridine synthase DusB [Spirochaetota bacterium]